MTRKERPPYLMVSPFGFFTEGEDPVVPTFRWWWYWVKTYRYIRPSSRFLRMSSIMLFRCLFQRAHESSLTMTKP